MIIKDDKLAQAEAVRPDFTVNTIWYFILMFIQDAESLTETPPPYSPAPAAGITVPTRPQPQPLPQSQTPPPHRLLSTPSSASLSPSASSTAVGSASGSGPSCEGGLGFGYPYKPPPRELARTGFVRIQRVNRSVKERMVVDPYIPFPPQAGDEEGEDFGNFGAGDGRRNVRLETKNGNVDAEVWVVGPGTDDDSSAGGDGRKKAGIDVRAKNGFVQFKIVSFVPSYSPSFTHPIFSFKPHKAYSPKHPTARILPTHRREERRCPRRAPSHLRRPAHHTHSKRLGRTLACARRVYDDVQRGTRHAQGVRRRFR